MKKCLPLPTPLLNKSPFRRNILNNSQDISRWVFEPCQPRAHAGGYAFCVCLNGVSIVLLKADALSGKPVHGFFNILYQEVEHGECGGRMVRLRVDHDLI